MIFRFFRNTNKNKNEEGLKNEENVDGCEQFEEQTDVNELT